jgi:hypothetical protein
MVDDGLVIGVTDFRGALGFVPAACQRMRLVDRVTTLFLADYLTRPRDYEDLVVCPDCTSVSFAWSELHHDGCDGARRSGIIRAKDGARATSPGIGSRVPT